MDTNHTLHVTFSPDLVGDADVPAYWLAQYGIVTNQETAVLDDLDGDDQFTWQEYVVGSNPTNWNTPFLLDGLLTDSGPATRTLHWASKEGRALYRLGGKQPGSRVHTDLHDARVQHHQSIRMSMKNRADRPSSTASRSESTSKLCPFSAVRPGRIP